MCGDCVNTLYFIFYAHSEHFQVIFLMEKKCEKQQNNKHSDSSSSSNDERRGKNHRIKSAYSILTAIRIARIYTADVVEVECGSSIHLFVLFVRSFIRSFYVFSSSSSTSNSFFFFFSFLVSLVPLVVALSRRLCFIPFHSIRHLMVLFIARCAYIEICTKLNVAIAAVAAAVRLIHYSLSRMI